MGMQYIKFDFKPTPGPAEQNGFIKRNFKNLIVRLLTWVIPKANPDFEDKIDAVKTWLLELDENNPPEREIGLDENGEVIMIMPWNGNHGYWTDNNLTLWNFINQFRTQNISKEDFETYWNVLA